MPKEPSLLQHLVVARHGSCLDDRLDSYGRQQMEKLGDIIKPLTTDPAQILSSSATRCRESAEVLASLLGIQRVETFDYLWSGKDSPWPMPYGDLLAVHELVTERKKHNSSLVLVTHLEVSNEYPAYFTNKEFGMSLYFDELPRGHAYFLDLSTRIWCTLPARVAVYKL